jgi:small GTP-binding protein
MATLDCKIVTLGEGRVGKTSLALKFVNGVFHTDEISTINANYLEKLVQIEKGAVQLKIWDTAGQERFRALASNYYRGAKGALVVYDITDRRSFDKVVSWITELKNQADKNIVIIVAGNKCDMERERQINRADALEFCRKMSIRHFDTSAKNGNGVDDAFSEMARLIYDANPELISSSRQAGRAGRQRVGVVVERKSVEKKDKGCC